MSAPNQERIKRKEKKQSKIRRGLCLLSVIILVILTLGACRLGKTIKQSRWDGQQRITLAVNSDPIMVFSYQPFDREVTFLIIPKIVYVQAAYGYGLYPAGSLWNLGSLKEAREGEFFTASLQEYFGIPISGWISAENEAFTVSPEEILAIKKKFTEIVFMAVKNDLKSSLKDWDLIRLWRLSRKVSLKNIKVIILEGTNAVSQYELADGTKVLAPEMEIFDSLVADLFLDQKINSENISVAIFNGTKTSGLANQAARLVGRLGIRVVETGDWPTEIENCEIQTSINNQKSLTVKKLKEIFACQFGPELRAGERSDVVLVIGHAYDYQVNGE